MTNITLRSLNVQVFNHPGKHTKRRYHLHEPKTHVLFLQETHFKQHVVPPLLLRHFNKWYTSGNPAVKIKVAAINFHSTLLEAVKTNIEGMFLFIKCLIQGMQLTLVNTYSICPTLSKRQPFSVSVLL